MLSFPVASSYGRASGQSTRGKPSRGKRPRANRAGRSGRKRESLPRNHAKAGHGARSRPHRNRRIQAVHRRSLQAHGSSGRCTMTPTQLIHSATRPGEACPERSRRVPVAQVTRGQLVELATKAMAALEEFMEALTPPAPVNMDAEPCSADTPVRVPANARTRKEVVDTIQQKVYEGTGIINCPECGDGPMIERQSAFGKFFGCVNYPTCQGKRNPPRRVSTKRGAMTQRSPDQRSPDTTRRTP
jgi:hypothetical protein